MKILSAEQIRLWDQFTIAREPITSLQLMERAAVKCAQWILTNYPDVNSFSIFCGKGNNGGDGLAIGRMLIQQNYSVAFYILEFGHPGTEDFQANLARLHQLPKTNIHFIQSEKNFHELNKHEIIIDALYGTGLNRKLEGVTANLVEHINKSGCEIISIDIPSGLSADQSSKGNTIIKALHTLTFQCYKLAFLIAENSEYIGALHILDIDLHQDFLNTALTKYELVDDNIIDVIFKPRKNFAHKGNFGHALMIAGSYGKIGAAVLSSGSCIRSGVGLLTCHIPACGYTIMQSTVPEAMVVTDVNEKFITKLNVDLNNYKSIGIGPGIGTNEATKKMLKEVFSNYKKPMVIDADALNIISQDKELMKLIPTDSILTPHPKEFERLFGETKNDFEKMEFASKKAIELNCVIILKGHHTFIATPGSSSFFNATGNAGMATGGSGDVLTGIITGLLAQGYSSVEAAILGVYIHGLAGDYAADSISMEAMVAGDIILSLGKVFLHLNS